MRFASTFRPLCWCALALVSACDAPKPVPSDAGSTAAAPPPAAAFVAPVAPSADPALARPATQAEAAAQRIVGSVLVGGRSMDYLRELADGIGPRLTGSESHARAAGWAVEAFRKAGVTRVAIEPFTIDHGWQRGPVTLKVVAPVEQALHAVAAGWTPDVPKEGLRAELVDLKDVSPKGLEAALKDKGALAGKLVLRGKGPGKMSAAIDSLAAHGAIGVVNIATRDNAIFQAYSGARGAGALAGPLPGVIVAREEGLRLQRLLDEGPVTVSVTNGSRLIGPTQVPNVIAEIRGRESPDEWVLVGAHLDSWDFATGAQDDGTGVAEVLEAARAIAAMPAPARRSIRFALFGGEEEGLLGSRAYAAAHAGELDRLVFMLNTDWGAEAPKGWSLDSRPDLVVPFRAAMGGLLVDLGADGADSDAHCWSDACTFLFEGVPTADLAIDAVKYDDLAHTVGDTIDKVSPGWLAKGAAVLAATAYAIADAPARVAPRVGRRAVDAFLERTDKYAEFVADGWEP